MPREQRDWIQGIVRARCGEPLWSRQQQFLSGWGGCWAADAFLIDSVPIELFDPRGNTPRSFARRGVGFGLTCHTWRQRCTEWVWQDGNFEWQGLQRDSHCIEAPKKVDGEAWWTLLQHFGTGMEWLGLYLCSTGVISPWMGESPARALHRSQMRGTALWSGEKDRLANKLHSICHENSHELRMLGWYVSFHWTTLSPREYVNCRAWSEQFVSGSESSERKWEGFWWRWASATLAEELALARPVPRCRPSRPPWNLHQCDFAGHHLCTESYENS